MKSLLISLTLGLLLSCTPKKSKDSTVVNPGDKQEIPFPHPKSFKNISQHGFLALNNLEGCKSCHGEDLRGKEGADSCYACHPSYPHTQWVDILNDHGKDLSEQDRNETCVKCHSKEVNKLAPEELADKVAKSCVECHSYPHPSSWMTKDHVESHGLISKELGNTKCIQCHTQNDIASEPNTALSCSNSNCHSQYPHDTNFKNDHAKLSLRIGSESLQDCQTCHITKDLTNNDPTPVYPEKSCFHCHSYPHPTEWTNQTSEYFHGNFVKNSVTKDSCDSCHGADWLGNGNPEKSCLTCHGNYPHTNTFKTTEAHGQEYIQTVNLDNSSKNCRNCHGDQLQGTSTAFSCKTCHEYFPHNWATPYDHGEQYRQKKDIPGFNCKSCHGENLEGSNFAPNCKSCHTEYPHDTSYWEGGPHMSRGIAIGENPPETDKYCKICHKNSLRNWDPKETCSGTCHSIKDIGGID